VLAGLLAGLLDSLLDPLVDRLLDRLDIPFTVARAGDIRQETST
jgi:hypothetical protein